MYQLFVYDFLFQFLQDTAFQTKFPDFTNELNQLNSAEFIKPAFSDLLQVNTGNDEISLVQNVVKIKELPKRQKSSAKFSTKNDLKQEILKSGHLKFRKPWIMKTSEESSPRFDQTSPLKRPIAIHIPGKIMINNACKAVW